MKGRKLTQLFEGKDPNYKEITFFAPPSLSILRYVWDKASGKEQFPGEPDRWRALSEDEKNHPEHLVQALRQRLVPGDGIAPRY